MAATSSTRPPTREDATAEGSTQTHGSVSVSDGTQTVQVDGIISRLQAVRSQFPFVAVMILYTILSLWLISLPTANPPFL
ncbi:hypothetical protein C9J85_03070 [Haloferax sp. wsp5]|nr:hypothetical protein C9J85_03070 [Haloferax sp. wsp5]